MTSQPMNTFEPAVAPIDPAALARPLPPLPPNAALRWDLVSRMMPEKVGQVLEIGCGRGAAAARIARRAEQMVALEPDKESFAVANENLRGLATVHNCMSYELPSSAKFDTVCAFEVLEHIEDDRVALKEWQEKLVPGGMLVLSAPAWQHRLSDFDHAVGHFRRYDPAQMAGKLEDAGFVDVKVELYGALAGYALETLRNLTAKSILSRKAEGADFAERTAGSGRLFQPKRGLSGIVSAVIAKPMIWSQRLLPNRGVGLVARARLPE